MMSKEIEKLAIEQGIKKKELAEKCGWSPQTFGNKLKRNSWSIDDLQKIASVLDLTLEIRFLPKPKTEVDEELEMEGSI